MGAARSVALALQLLSIVAIVNGEAQAGGSDYRCQRFFAGVQRNLTLCKDALVLLEDEAPVAECPESCNGMFDNLPTSCAQFVDRQLPRYRGPKPANASQPFDICDRLYCPEDEDDCDFIIRALVRALDLFRLPYVVGGASSTYTNKTSVAEGSSVNVGAIVAGVVCGNALIVVTAAVIMWLRRRHKRCRQAAQAAAAAAPESGAGGSSTGKLESCDPLDSLECGGGSAAGAIGLAKPGGGARGVAISAATAPPPPRGYASSEGGETSASGRIAAAPATPRSPYGMAGVAQLWAAAAAAGESAAGSGPGTAVPPSPPFSVAATTVAEHIQQDELEMMQMGGSATTSQPPSMHSDPLLSWVNSQLREEGDGGDVVPPAAAAAPRRSGEVERSGPSGGSSRAGLSSLALRRSSGLVDLKPWQLKYGELRIQRPLGEGSCGKVFLATWNETLVAVKLLLSTDDAATAAKSGGGLRSLPAPALAELEKEAGLMASLRHPNIVLFLGVCSSPPAVVTEYCSRGSLLDVLRAGHASPQAAQQLTWIRRLSMALDAAKGMLCLHAHSPPILHRDLKSPNLLVDAAWRVKVCDFNLSKILEDTARSSSAGGMLNPRWLAPEVLMGRPATAESDVFSFGTVLWELLTWRLPWEGANLYQLVFMVSRGERLPIPPPEELPGADALGPADAAAYVALIQRCWAQEPSQRPSFAEAITELRGIMSKLVASAAMPALPTPE